jgi:PTH1 family peptidyl-tRNA hydrolase
VKVIVGLGNPGPKYRNTRHNLGFLVLDALAERLGVSFDTEKHQGLLATAVHEGQKLLLIKPLTFMNLSGDCVAPAVRNKVAVPADILVVVDEVHLPLGRVRLRAEGSAGGHNGLKSLIERLGTQAFPRLRMGVGDDRKTGDLSAHVLGTFHPDEYGAVKEMVEKGVEAALLWTSAGVEKAMNVHNQG